MIAKWVAFRNGYQINLDIIASSDESEMAKLKLRVNQEINFLTLRIFTESENAVSNLLVKKNVPRKARFQIKFVSH